MMYNVILGTEIHQEKLRKREAVIFPLTWGPFKKNSNVLKSPDIFVYLGRVMPGWLQVI